MPGEQLQQLRLSSGSPGSHPGWSCHNLTESQGQRASAWALQAPQGPCTVPQQAQLSVKPLVSALWWGEQEPSTAQRPQSPAGVAEAQLLSAGPGLMSDSGLELLILSATSTAWGQHSHPKRDTQMSITPSLCQLCPG